MYGKKHNKDADLAHANGMVGLTAEASLWLQRVQENAFS